MSVVFIAYDHSNVGFYDNTFANTTCLYIGTTRLSVLDGKGRRGQFNIGLN